MKQFDEFKPKLTPDVKLRFLKEDERGRFYIIGRGKDPVFLKVHQVGKDIIEMFDGHTRVAEIEDALKHRDIEVDLLRFLRVLGKKGFLENYPSPVTSEKEGKLRVYYLPFIKSPEKIFSKVYPPLSRFSKTALWLPFLTFNFSLASYFILLSVLGLLDTHEMFFIQHSTFLAFAFYFVFIIPFLGLLHEFAHAITCFHYGGRPSEIGVAVYLFTFLFYTDTSDTWMFDKRKSVSVFLAGPLMTLFIGNICFVLYLISPISSLNKIFIMIAFGSYLSVLFGLDPLIESDGYYILQTLAKFPNLHSHAWNYTLTWFKYRLRLLSKEEYQDFIACYSKSEKKVLAVYAPLAIIANCIFLAVTLPWSFLIVNEYIRLTLAIIQAFPHVEPLTTVVWAFETIYIFLFLIYSLFRILRFVVKRLKRSQLL